MSIELRKLKSEHSGLYRKIRLESLKLNPEAFEATYEKEHKQDMLFFEKLVLSEDKRKFIIGAFKGDVLIGICGFVDDNRYELDQTGSIIQMYVKSEFSGQKIGEQLLLFAEQKALMLSGISVVMLEVNKNNKRAIKVYKNCGYKEFNVTKTLGEHLVCMAR